MINQLILVNKTTMKRSCFSYGKETIIDIISGNSKYSSSWDSCFIDLLASADFIKITESEFSYNIQNTELFSN